MQTRLLCLIQRCETADFDSLGLIEFSQEMLHMLGLIGLCIHPTISDLSVEPSYLPMIDTCS